MPNIFKENSQFRKKKGGGRVSLQFYHSYLLLWYFKDKNTAALGKLPRAPLQSFQRKDNDRRKGSAAVLSWEEWVKPPAEHCPANYRQWAPGPVSNKGTSFLMPRITKQCYGSTFSNSSIKIILDWDTSYQKRTCGLN